MKLKSPLDLTISTGITFILVSLPFFLRIHSFPLHDFANYYFGARFLDSGHFNISWYQPILFNKAIASLGYSEIFASYAPNPPSLALFFIPLKVFSPVHAKIVFTGLSYLLFVWAVIRLSRQFEHPDYFLITLPLIFIIPIRNGILFGQVYFFLFYLLVEGFLSLKKKNYLLMAFTWGLAVLLKIFPVILLCYLLFKKELKGTLYFTVVISVLLGVSIYLNGFEAWSYFIHYVMPKASSGEIAGEFVPNFQSIHMLLKQLFVIDSVNNPVPLFDSPILFQLFLIFSKIGLLFVGIYASVAIQSEFRSFGIWIIISYLLTPYGSTYSLVLLLIPVLAFWSTNRKKNLILLITAFLVANLPVSLFSHFPVILQYPRLLLLLTFMLLILLNSNPPIPSKWYFISFSLSISMGIILPFVRIQKTNDVQSWWTDQLPTLTYQMTCENDSLKIWYWDQNGDHSMFLQSLTCNQYPSEETLKDGQIYLGNKQLTYDSSNKKDPIRLNKNRIIFLSDVNRGIGFYTIKALDIP